MWRHRLTWGDFMDQNLPRFSSAICSEIPVPPYTQTACKLRLFVNFLMSLPICMHSSRVGVIMIEMGPSVSSNGGWSSICLNIGNKNANVLPLPVFAIPIKSLPDIMAGIACAWIGVGFSKPNLRRIFISFVETPHWAHVFIGFGQPRPMNAHNF